MKSLASLGLALALVSANVFAADPTPAAALPVAGAGTGAAGTTGILATVTPAVGAAVGFGVVAVAAVERVVARLHLDTVVARLAVDCVLAKPAKYPIVAIAAVQGILTAVLIDKFNGNVINDFFERNIFQSVTFSSLFFMKYPFYTKEWFKKIYNFDTHQNSQFFIYFGNFSQSNEPTIKIFMYPFLTDSDTVSLLSEIDRKIVFNQDIFSEVKRIKKIATAENISLIVQVMPLKAILCTPANSIYFEISGKDRYEIQTIFNAIMEK